MNTDAQGHPAAKRPRPTRSRRVPQPAESSADVIPLRLVHSRRPSEDTIRCLRALLERAERGEIIGVSFAAMQADREFFVANCGEAHHHPAWATALSATLHHANVRRIFGEE